MPQLSVEAFIGIPAGGIDEKSMVVMKGPPTDGMLVCPGFPSLLEVVDDDDEAIDRCRTFLGDKLEPVTGSVVYLRRGPL